MKSSSTTTEQAAALKNRPTYAAAFRCIGADCEDACCGDWDIPLDRATYEKYQQFPAKDLGPLVSNFVSLNAVNAPEGLYAQINRGPSGTCPFLNSERLCSIQKEYGHQLLSATCSIYPRSLSRVHGVLEGSLSLSCPEAARNVLLNPAFMQIEGDLFSGAFRTDNVYRLAGGASGSLPKPYGSFHAVRALLIEMVRDRSHPLWHRLLSIGSLCQRLDAIAATGNEAVPAFLKNYRHMLANPGLHAEFESMPSEPALKLEVVLGLADERAREKTCGKRFRDTFWTFVEGIGSPNGSTDGSTPGSPNGPTPGDDIGRFLHAEKTYHRPFFEKSPFILENYLLNYMFQHLFPFGREGSARFTPRTMFAEFILMTTQFAWIDALLIGIAGRYREAFAEEHIVHAIQSFTREVEHYPHVLNSIAESIAIRKMDSLQGMSVMLKN